MHLLTYQEKTAQFLSRARFFTIVNKHASYHNTNNGHAYPEQYVPQLLISCNQKVASSIKGTVAQDKYVADTLEDKLLISKPQK